MIEAVVAGIVSIIVSTVGSLMTARREAKRLREAMRPQLHAEQAIKELLSDERWELRSFDAIKRRVGAFEDDELRKLLLGAGALSWLSPEGEELWGLKKRNKHRV
ncbi:hypothetical protein AB0M95_15870 [Sphaerisporangium sp. NPDC051017]|uniref:hypothetical protein n=1 Tax=Sphaerisporangium sp. NPDC051017 TaxID=3154636 RepID=UPI0034186D5B